MLWNGFLLYYFHHWQIFEPSTAECGVDTYMKCVHGL